MTEITITVNSRAVHEMLRHAPGQIDGAMKAATNDAVTYLLALAKRYPPQRSGSAYVRTNTLMRSWSKLPIQGSGLSVRGGIGSNSNMAPYNRRVMSRSDQARIHRGRWEPVENIVERSRGTVQGFFDSRLHAALR